MKRQRGGVRLSRRGSSDQRADRRLRQAAAWIELDGAQARGEIDVEAMLVGGIIPAQRARASRAIFDQHLDGLAHRFALAADVDADVAAGRRRCLGHRLHAVVDRRPEVAEVPVQPLLPEPAQVGAVRARGGGAQRRAVAEHGARGGGEALRAEHIGELVVDERGRRPDRHPGAHAVADVVAIVDVAEVAARRREQRRVQHLIDGGDEIERAQDVGRVFQPFVAGAREQLGEVRGQHAGGARAVDRRLVRADGGVGDDGEDGARDLQVVVLAQPRDGEDAEDLIGDQDDVAVLLDELVAQRRLDQRHR